MAGYRIFPPCESGTGNGNRTRDILLKRQVLYLLSYASIKGLSVRRVVYTIWLYCHAFCTRPPESYRPTTIYQHGTACGCSPSSKQHNRSRSKYRLECIEDRTSLFVFLCPDGLAQVASGTTSLFRNKWRCYSSPVLQHPLKSLV